SRKLVLPCPFCPKSTVVCGETCTCCGCRLRKARVCTSRRSIYSLTHMSMGTPAPALLHWYFAGQRGGGFLAFLVTSTGAPGTILVVPASNEAQGRTQKPCGMALPLASDSFRQRCERPLQSLLWWQLRPRPSVRGS